MSILSQNSDFVTRHLKAPGTDKFDQYGVATSFQARPGYNNTGQPVKVQVNSYEVANFPTKPIYQYDVSPSETIQIQKANHLSGQYWQRCGEEGCN